MAFNKTSIALSSPVIVALDCCVMSNLFCWVLDRSHFFRTEKGVCRNTDPLVITRDTVLFLDREGGYCSHDFTNGCTLLNKNLEV